RAGRGPAARAPRSKGRNRSRSRSFGALGLRLAVFGPFLVDRPCGALLGLVLAHTPILVGILDVFVLAFALGAPGFLWHPGHLRRVAWDADSSAGGATSAIRALASGMAIA